MIAKKYKSEYMRKNPIQINHLTVKPTRQPTTNQHYQEQIVKRISLLVVFDKNVITEVSFYECLNISYFGGSCPHPCAQPTAVWLLLSWWLCADVTASVGAPGRGQDLIRISPVQSVSVTVQVLFRNERSHSSSHRRGVGSSPLNRN